MTDHEFPVAQVTSGKRPRLKQWSWMWLVTLACAVLALGLVWHSLDSPGQEILIRFPEGHGLRPGDAVRHRGIEIGRVASVQLKPSLDGIEVRAVLIASAEPIACEGSRFWIVRPQLDFTGVSGLETAVGAKYIAVIPGGTQTEQTDFDGLSSRPPDGLSDRGIEIILRGDHRYGVNPGSPLTWRGIEVGQVLSTGLSPDALHVDTRVRVLDSYRRLLSRDSKFWVTSGIQMGLDVTGFELSTESLSTIARGGIAFITPGRSSKTGQVQPGDVFTLHEEQDDRWIESAPPMNLLELAPPPMTMVEASWKQKHFGITRSHEIRASAISVPTDQDVSVLVPADLIEPPAGTVDDSYQLAFLQGKDRTVLDLPPNVQLRDGIAAVPITSAPLNSAGVLAADRIRRLDAPEDCFAVRKSWSSDQDSAVVIEMIGKDELSRDGSVWRSTNTKLSRDLWHGAAVVATNDEKVIGMLIISDDGPVVAPLPMSLTKS